MVASGRVRRRVASLREAIASRLWPVPLAAVVAGVLLGIALPLVDRAADESLPPLLQTLLFSGGVDAARAVLSAIAGSLITAASLTFSLTVVALQLASSQASPRLLRLFASDRMVHATLALFLGTFSYALTVLRSVEDATDTAEEFVPRIAMTTASVLTLASVVLLTVFLGHLARELRVETMLRNVHREASETLRRMVDDPPGRAAPVPTAPPASRTIDAPRSGFITGVDRGRLISLASQHDVVIEELRPVGADVVERTPLARWWRAGAGDTTPIAADALEAEILECFDADFERTAAQDIGFGLRQLADVASKALSPGVNDPTTAVHALGHIAALLADVAERARFPEAYADDGGVARLIPADDRFEELLEVGVEQVRRYGAGDPDVAARLYGLLGDIARRAQEPSRRAALLGQLTRLDASVSAQDYDDVERERFGGLSERTRALLGGSG